MIATAAGDIYTTRSEYKHIAPGTKVSCSIRPESLEIDSDGTHPNQLTAKILDSVYFGNSIHRELELPGGVAVKAIESNEAGTPSDTVRITVDPKNVVILDR